MAEFSREFTNNINKDSYSSFDNFTDKEEKVFEDILKEVRSQKEELSKPKQIKEIVSIEEWMENPYYIGKDGANLYDYWKEVLYEVFKKDRPKEKKINELLITGSLGTGKSTAAIYAMMRKLYELSCFENVPALFDLMSTSLIVFIYFSITKTQAELTGFGQFRSVVDTVPYFRNEWERNMNINKLLYFPENILFTYGSEAGHTIGMNMLGCILDEANFYDDSGNQKQAMSMEYTKISNLYASIINRGKSRFQDGDDDHSLSILVSSATHSSSFTQKRIEESVDDPHTMVVDSKLWEVKPNKYSKETFWVFAGSELLDPFIIESVAGVNEFLDSIDEDKINPEYNSIDFAISKVPVQYKHLFIEIPIDFKKSFKTNLVKALQDIAGYSVAPMGRLFTNKPVYNRAVQRGKDGGLKHPFYKETFVISTNSKTKVEDFLRKDFIFQNKNKPRFIHIDQSLNDDSTGFAMSHIADIREEGEVSKPYIKVDLMILITPPMKPQQISISKIRDFIFYLRDERDLTIKKVTYDWFGCLTAGHKVPTKRGILNIEDIDIGDKVLTRNGYKGVINTFRYEDSPTIKIKTKSGKNIEGTPNHKILVLRKWVYKKGKRFPEWEWKRLDKIEEKDVVFTEMLETDKEEYVELLDGGKEIGYGHGKMDGFILPEYLDEELAYIIGYYLGDGRMDEDGISFSYNKGEFEKFNKKVKDYFGYDMLLHEREEVGRDGKKYIKRTLTLSSRQLVRFLEKNGVKRIHGLDKYIPDIIWKSPKTVISSFVDGLVDSDGCVDGIDKIGSGRIQFTNHSKKLTYGLQNLLMLGLGIKSTISIVDNTKYDSELVPECADKGYRLRTVGERAKLHDIPSWKIQENSSEVVGRDIFDRVEVIERGQKNVFDIEVEEEHAYYSNGFYSHNSAESKQTLIENGIEAEHRSLDRKDEAYISFVNLFFENRIDIYKYETFEKELFELIHDRKRGKVDHPPDSSKDISDAVAGSVVNALESEMSDSAGGKDGSIIAEVNRGNIDEGLFTVEDLLDDFIL